MGSAGWVRLKQDDSFRKTGYMFSAKEFYFRHAYLQSRMLSRSVLSSSTSTTRMTKDPHE
jgi:hypothetical protein